MAGRKLRTWVTLVLAALGAISLFAVVSSVSGPDRRNNPNATVGKVKSRGDDRPTKDTHSEDHDEDEGVEVPLGVAVKHLRGKINQLRKPVDALLHRLEEVSVDSRRSQKGKEQPRNFHLVWHQNAQREKRLFVSLTSYDGLECRETIRSLYAEAASPEHIFVGVTEVHEPGTPSCQDPAYSICNVSVFCPSDNIRRRSIQPKNYKGTTHSHHIGSLMYRGEQYVMMLTPSKKGRKQLFRFLPKWDQMVLEEYLVAAHAGQAANSPQVKTLLTGVPLQGPASDSGSEHILFGGKPLQSNCKVELKRGEAVAIPVADAKPGGQPTFDWANILLSPKGGTPNVHQQNPVKSGDGKGGPTIMTPFVSYQFLFGTRDILLDAPIDPHLKYLSPCEEELVQSVKFYTHGYAFHVPRRSPLWAVEDAAAGSQGPAATTELSPLDQSDRVVAQIRAGMVFGQVKESDIRRFAPNHAALAQRSEFEGVGKLRSAGQFFAAAGIDIHNFVVKDMC